MIFTYDEAVNYIERAYKDTVKFPQLRFGQALWNILPVEVTTQFTGTSKDFFYEQCPFEAHDKFVKNFVIEDTISD